MSDQRPDDETIGRALGRAVESQTVRETPYASSRLAGRVDRPAARGWTSALPVAAALALFVAMGAYFATRGPQNAGAPDASVTPAVSATSGPLRTTTPPSPTAAPAESALVYFARDQLAPVGASVPATAPFGTLPAAERISARLRALWDAPAPGGPAPSGAALGNNFRPAPGHPALRSVSTTISGDTATVVLDAGAWGGLSSNEGIGLFQQLVYTITEEPGIRRAAVREPGKDHAIIGNGVFKDPLSREDVLGYAFLGMKEARVSVGDSDLQPRSITDWRASVDDVGLGLTRFVVELAPSALAPQGLVVPRFTAELKQNARDDDVHKWELRVTMPDAIWPDVARTGQPFQCCSVKRVDRTPLRWISAGPEREGNARGAIFTLALDDARPWRTTVLQSPLRLVVDIGGTPRSVSESVAVYDPSSLAFVSRTFTFSGLARAFEANVNWRVRASSGSVVASGFTTASIGTSAVWGTFQAEVALPASVGSAVTLEVFEASARDGSDTNKVSIPLQVR